MTNISMKNANDASVPKWVELIRKVIVSVSICFADLFGGQNHNVGMSSGIDRVLVSAEVVRCMIDADNFVNVKAFVFDLHCITLFL